MNLQPEITFQVDTIDFVEVFNTLLPDENINNIINNLKNKDEYWNDFISSFESNEDKDYLLNKFYSSDDIKIVLNKKLLNNILINFDAHDSNENFANLLSDIKYTYYPKEVYPDLDEQSFNEYLRSSI